MQFNSLISRIINCLQSNGLVVHPAKTIDMMTPKSHFIIIPVDIFNKVIVIICQDDGLIWYIDLVDLFWVVVAVMGI